MSVLAQKYRLAWPLNPEQLVNIDEMFEDLYRQVSTNIATINATLPTLTFPSSGTIGDIFYLSGTTTVSLLGDVATGNALISGGVGLAPAWGKIVLSTHVSGTLGVTNGGTGASTFTQGSIVFAGASGVYTQDNATLFYDDANDRLGLGIAIPIYKLDVRAPSSTLSQLHISSSSSDVGGYFTSFATFNSFVISCNAAFNASNWIAKGTTSAAISLDTGTITFLANSGLSAASSFTPTTRGIIYPSGGASFLGTASDPGSGVFRIDGSLTLTTALTVANGGTGKASLTAYAVLCGGTTTTAAIQSIASVGSLGDVLTSNGAGALPTFNTPSGTYTPTLTNVANLDASTAYTCQYMRVGATVTVSGKVDVDPTAATTSTKLGISLPIASNFANPQDCGGTAHASAIAGQGAAILADATNDRAQMEWISGDVTNQPMYFSFTYRII